MRSVASTKCEPIGPVGVLHYKSPQDVIGPPLPPRHAIIAFNFLAARKTSTEVIMIKRTIAVLVSAVMIGCASGSGAEAKWISLFNGKLIMTYDDAEYKTGHFAIQGHNPGMKVEAKELYYMDLSK